MNIDNPAKDRFRSSPARFLEEFIKTLVRSSPLNRLDAFDGTHIFDDPLIGFADGDDPLFEEYKT